MSSTANLRVTHLREVKLQQLDALERRELETTLANIFLTSFVGPSAQEVLETFVYRGPDLRVVLLLNSAEEVLGFASSSIARYQVGGREHALLDGGVYVLPGVRKGGAMGVRMCFRHALAHMVRHPRMPIANVGLALHPASYRRLRAILPGFHPRQGASPSPEVEVLVREIAARKKLVAVAADPWVVRRSAFDVCLREPERLASALDDADARYYTERNPGYAGGDALLTYYALDARNLLSSVAQVLVSYVSRA